MESAPLSSVIKALYTFTRSTPSACLKLTRLELTIERSYQTHSHTCPQARYVVIIFSYYIFSSVQSLSHVRLCNPMGCSTPGFPIFNHLSELAQTHSIESVMPSNHLILCHPLLFLPSVFPNIRVFTNESFICIRWPKHWSFSFSISPSNAYSGLISFRIDWFDLLAV